jgi:uncharacterized membrane protein YgcG
MRFFKYLIFLFVFFTSYSNASSIPKYFDPESPNDLRDTPLAACQSRIPKLKAEGHSQTQYYRARIVEGSLTCFIENVANYGQTVVSFGVQLKYVVVECFHPDYKIVSQPITSLKKTMCLPINGAICKYVGDPTGSPIVNGKITTTFSSVSKTPDPSCKEELVNPPCDPKDPYGGCFTPPNDNCTRQFNGSIECPPDIQPPIEKGCNGATYCDRPPQGCGEGYVSGSFNGKQLCVKTSPSTGSGDGSGTGGDGSGTGGDGSGTGGDGSGTGTGTGTSTSTSTNTTTNSDGSTTTTTNTTVNNFSIDFGPMIKAINDVVSKITNLKNELLTSITELGKKLDSTNNKIDSTNQKLDSTNSKLTEINDSSLRQEELLKAIRDKESSTGGNGSPSEQPASVASTDLSGVHSRLDAIKEGIDKKNEFDKEFSEWAKDPDFKDDSNPAFSGDSKVEIQESTAAPDLKDNYVSASAQCPPPLQISFNLLRTHTLTFSYDTMCLGASFARPFVIFSGMLIAFLIVTGSYRGSSDA